MKEKKQITIKINGIETIIVLPKSIKEFPRKINTKYNKVNGLVCLAQ